MPKKPARYGLKFWNVCDVKSAYLLDTDIYLGKGLAEAANDDEDIKPRLEKREILIELLSITYITYII